MWNNSYSPSVLLDHAQCMVLSCSLEGVTCFVVVIYVATIYTNMKYLWEALSDLLHIHIGPWLLIGDFNTILGAHEKLGGRLPHKTSCFDFLNWTNAHSLIHLETKGVTYTGTNKREGAAFIAQRLDRGPYAMTFGLIVGTLLVVTPSSGVILITPLYFLLF